MHQEQQTKIVKVCAPAILVDDASLTTLVIDTKGARSCTINVWMGATDIALTALKCQEADVASDTTTLTSGADVTGLVFGTSANIAGSTSALPSATDDNNVYRFEVNLQGRKRYLKPTVTVGNGSVGGYVAVWAELHGLQDAPVSASERGFGDILRA